MWALLLFPLCENISLQRAQPADVDFRVDVPGLLDRDALRDPAEHDILFSSAQQHGVHVHRLFTKRDKGDRDTRKTKSNIKITKRHI